MANAYLGTLHLDKDEANPYLVVNNCEIRPSHEMIAQPMLQGRFRASVDGGDWKSKGNFC